MGTTFSIAARAEKAASFLSTSYTGIGTNALLEILAEEGITDDAKGFSLLESSAVTLEDLVGILGTRFPEIKKIPLKAAAGALKGTDLVKQEPVPAVPTIPVLPPETFAKIMRPIQQWDDRLLLEQFIKDRDPEIEAELDRRAQRNKFIVLKPGKFEPGKEEIDVEKSLGLLKMARKRTTPGTIPNGSIFSLVYRITELNPQDRISELCPICGETLYQGYCEKCQSSFAGMDDDSRAYAKLVADSVNFNAKSFSDRKALLASAMKGLEDLRQTWPMIAQTFDDLKLTNSLPKLRIIGNRPSTVADPYHVGGVRMTGNKSF